MGIDIGILTEKDNNPTNSKGQLHGFQQHHIDDKLWYRGCCKNNIEIGYHEENYESNHAIGDEGTEVNFYIT